MFSPPIRISQGHLNLLETCFRKYQHIYLDQLGSPIEPEQQESLIWGSQFHLLMQQRELGLPVQIFLQENAEFDRSVSSLVQAAPDVVNLEDSTGREAEHPRTLTWGRYLLVAIYDLLIVRGDRAEIFDWKTHRQPQKRDRLARHWQTRLYPFVLAETSDFTPEQISLTYWFVGSRPQSLKFSYNTVQHEQTRTDLTQLLTQLQEASDRYQTDQIPFPQVSLAKKICSRCEFAARCQRIPNQRISENKEKIKTANFSVSLDSIKEIPL
ncbi:PD-(D/E)XK nuclease family protein [Spirulina sp. 06S082]|uniref:PD-(D/E)XK nuclease family protein n=1 Tax=Spirulina sp. 06S082 TaxID=3110248 RepID=UPI002B1F52C3|nr:PD-(D/E)XK nuclease family protein [Spirulina sp. 06S082]MEA5468263.1 PD-(D/E)XK nuclease family protein [Spirulina sp. 06S082]